MSCKYNSEQVEAYALGLLNEKERVKVAAHLKKCDACQAHAAQQQQAAAFLQQAFSDEVPTWVVKKTMAALKQKQFQRPASRWLAWGTPMMVGATAMVLVALLQPGWFAVPGHNKSGRALRPAAAVLSSAGLVIKPEGLQIRGTMSAPARLSRITGDWDTQLANPIHDRSLYKDLGVATEVASLLL